MRHLFTELRQGLLRNVSMHIAVILTLFVSLSLVGLGVLSQRESAKTVEYLGNELQITVWLCKAEDDRPQCLGEVTEPQQRAIERAMEENPEVEDYDFKPQTVAFEEAKDLLGAEQFEGEDAPLQVEDLRASYRVTLEDPDEFAGIVSAVEGLDGVSYIADLREELEPIYLGIGVIQKGAIGIAVALIIAALLLVANTVRLAALARRKEIGIMRLVGASSLYISLPFLVEALFTAVVSVLLSAGALAAAVHFGVIEYAAERLDFLPWIGWDDYWFTVAVVAILGPALTLLPTLLLARKYSKV